MEIVSKDSEADLARQRANNKLQWILRELAANLLRVIRGAGKPYEIAPQAQALADAFREYYEVAGYYPFDPSGALSISHNHEFLTGLDAENREEIRAEDAVIRGSLQIAASRLLGQTTQERAGEGELFRGYRELEAVRTKRRARLAQANTASSSATGRSSKRKSDIPENAQKMKEQIRVEAPKDRAARLRRERAERLQRANARAAKRGEMVEGSTAGGPPSEPD